MVEIASSYAARPHARSGDALLRSAPAPALQVASAIDAVRRASDILEAMRARTSLLDVTDAALEDGISTQWLLEPILDAVADDTDTVTGLAAVHALGRLPGPLADAELNRVAFDGPPGFEEHVAWTLESRQETPWLIDLASSMVVRGGLAGMHAQTALARWALRDHASVLLALGRRLHEADHETGRRHLIETVGLVPGRPARALLERIASDPAEGVVVRRSAILAFSERLSERLPRSFGAIARSSDPVAATVRTVRTHRSLARRGPRRTGDRSSGIKVSQVHLGAVLDEAMSRAGVGSTGGVATLLTNLGAALSRQERVAEVLTIGRAEAGRADQRRPSGIDHRYDHVPLHDGEGTTFASPWPALVEARRGIKTALLARGVPDVIHLRMADPGSLAASDVARELRIPTVFTLAPDPHGPIEEGERAGRLDRRTFASEDAAGALWFRHDVVRLLDARASQVALFPRPRLRQRIERLTGIDVTDGQPKYTIVPEGVDTAAAEHAAAAIATGTSSIVLDALASRIRRLPPRRHGLPIMVSVGRLAEMKGMARVVEAFASDPQLMARANLVIVGGDLATPNPAEAAELARIDRLMRRSPELRDAVVLIGHRPNPDVALILAAAHAGWAGMVGSGGAYVSGSHKEEFGLAIVEALAAGLPVVAPRSGGPASYVEEGATGVLVDTSEPAAIALGARRCLELARDPATARQARSLVGARYTVERMARVLTAVYRIATGAPTLAVTPAEGSGS